MSIHPTAVVDPGAEIGPDVEIGPGAVISAQTRIGAGCRIGPHAVLFPHVTLGARCRVHAHAVLGDLPQDLKFQEGVVTRVEVGDDCSIREGVTIHRGTKEGSVTRVGKGCLLMVNAHVGHNCEVGNQVILANGVLLGGHVTVGDRAFLSGNVAIHQFVRVGRLCMVGGQGGLTQDLLPFCLTESGKMNGLVGLNIVGLRRAGFSPEDRLQLQRAYRKVFRTGFRRQRALEILTSEFATGPAAEWIPYLETTHRGVCSPYVEVAEAADAEAAATD